MKLDLVAQLAFAGGLIGFLVGPNSIDEFIGIFPNNQIWMNVIVGVITGAALGFAASFLKETE